MPSVYQAMIVYERVSFDHQLIALVPLAEAQAKKNASDRVIIRRCV